MHMYNNKPVAIFLCEFIGLAAEPWLEAGIECWLIDPKHPEHVTRDPSKPGLVKVGYTVLEALPIIRALIKSRNIIHVAAFPVCDDLTVAGTGSWARKFDEDRYFQAKASILITQCIMVGEMSGSGYYWENPVGASSTIFGKPSFYFDPADYGGYLPEDDIHPLWPDIYPARDAYPKKTCIWAGGGLVIPEKKPIKLLSEDNPGWKKLGGKSARTKEIRSSGPRGYLRAVFEANYN